jgi:hypothetical protein
MLKVVTTVNGEPAADLLCTRLSEAGIAAIYQRSIGGPEWGASGAQDIFVEEVDLDRAREALSAEGLDDDQLGELSDQAYRDATGHDPAG